MDYSESSGLKFPKGEKGYVKRHQRKVANAAALDACYAQVDARDRGICRVTGAHTTPGAVNPDQRREHHHLVKRSRDRGMVSDPENVITVSATAHKLIEDGWIIQEGTRASGVLRFHWNTDTPASMKIVRIKSRRWSSDEAT